MEEGATFSVLGTLEYWDDTYDNELRNFSDHGDVGEVWFGESISKKIINWIVEKSGLKPEDNIIDIGCGNGMLLIDLYKKGFKALHGIDYSKNAIDLALNISKSECCNVNLRVINVLDNKFFPYYNLALDKGTFDAISLDPENSKSKLKTYIQNVWKLLKDDGIFFITSCNWTENELQEQFESYFIHMETLSTPSITFGGQKGFTVTSIIFKKKKLEHL